MKKNLILLLSVLTISCNSNKGIISSTIDEYESEILTKNAEHENPRMRFKLVQSKVLDKKKLEKTISKQLNDFSESDYTALTPLIFEQDIPTIQAHIEKGTLTYKRLSQWYLYRIRKYEIDPKSSLHTIIAINPNVVEEASLLDEQKDEKNHPIYGMPILLKDNINTSGMPTTAGSLALQNNLTEDAFIVKKLKAKKALILGKVNLSEWAYFFCSGCPLGYSAIGGQTLNPYGRAIFESGGSSSGSGTSMAANYAVGAVGTETSGSILSPSSQNSVVGLKPTVGLLSRGGIVPISSTLDTPGPMTRNVTDNAILLSAMIGSDPEDTYTSISKEETDIYDELGGVKLNEIRIGANKSYMNEVPLYAELMLDLNRIGVEVYGYEPEDFELRGFLSILNIDMRNDLPTYLEAYANSDLPHKSIKDIMSFNQINMDLRAPYGQALFQGIVDDQTTDEELQKIISEGREKARAYFDNPMKELDLDVIISINNYDASRAAIAHYPALTIPMGYKENGEPMNYTLIASSLSEEKLLKIGYALEQVTKRRIPPKM